MKKNKYNKDVYRSMTLITQFGINMIVPIFLCTFLGIFIDKKLGTNFVVVILFFLGAIAGARNVYIFAKGIYDKPKKGVGDVITEDSSTKSKDDTYGNDN